MQSASYRALQRTVHMQMVRCASRLPDCQSGEAGTGQSTVLMKKAPRGQRGHRGDEVLSVQCSHTASMRAWKMCGICYACYSGLATQQQNSTCIERGGTLTRVHLTAELSPVSYLLQNVARSDSQVTFLYEEEHDNGCSKYNCIWASGSICLPKLVIGTVRTPCRRLHSREEAVCNIALGKLSSFLKKKTFLRRLERGHVATLSR